MKSRPAFTLVELLVVVTIIVIVSSVTIPLALPFIRGRQVSEGARLVHAVIARAQQAAIQANAPRGIRLIPDYQFGGPTPSNPLAALACSTIIPIEPAPDYTAGRVDMAYTAEVPPRIAVVEVKTTPDGLPSEPTAWYWNVRQGDQIRIGSPGGQWYTVAGPLRVAGGENGEQFVNDGKPVRTGPGANISLPTNGYRESLYLVNSADDDLDGYTDESFDGIDNDGDGITDPAYNNLDDNGDGVIDEFAECSIGDEVESTGEFFTAPVMSNVPYVIRRRPVPSQRTGVVTLPQGMVIDLTTFDSTRERSRVPVNPVSKQVDIMFAPTGQVIGSGAGMTTIPKTLHYHLWLAEREDIREPLAKPVAPQLNRLPMLAGSANYLPIPDWDLLGEIRIVTIATRTGRVSATTPYESLFDARNLDGVFREAALEGRNDPN